MSFAPTYHAQGGTFPEDYRSSFGRRTNNNSSSFTINNDCQNSCSNNFYRSSNHNNFWNNSSACVPSRDFKEHGYNFNYVYVKPDNIQVLKKRKFSASTWEGCRRNYQPPNSYDAAPSTCNSSAHPSARPNNNSYMPISCKRDCSELEDGDVVFMSRDEIERCSPSRKDGIDVLRETHLRYSYCAFIQNLGLRLELPQTTIGTAMVLCHRFFVRRSHACHDRFLIATAALFLAAKSEDTPCPLNNVLRVSSEILHKQDLTFLSYLLPVGWFEQYRDRVLEAEQMILTTLDFELNVQHPYAPLTSILSKLGFSQTVLVNLALSLVSEGVYKISVLACMIILAGGLKCCSWKVLFYI
ncbi:uncharacterized protein LOC131150720 isoform X2 [Malania oleifera]|uniref:uncharacterized protein LOC131150720 isoform X2 n=1 Tax=Malania oleifera TaxID=397392 RepID=UPI0025AECC18|nr:uncharacterized protein LOC131150720 isoform X2 [Malania oleifera]